MFSRAVATPWRTETRLIPDERPVIESTLSISSTDTAATWS